LSLQAVQQQRDEERLEPLSNFQSFFQLAAADLGISIRHTSFDPNAVEVDSCDVQDFLGTLDFLMKKATPLMSRKREG